MGSSEKHGSVKQYWIFCVILCVITFFEWLIFEKRIEWGITAYTMVPMLIVMSLVKFVMVVGWYMHLRFDHNWLKYVFIVSLLMGAGIGISLCVLM